MNSIYSLLLISLLVPFSAAAASTHTVTMKSISFDPKKLEIPAGDSVEWVNGSLTQHSATFAAETKMDTGLIDPKKTSKKMTFSQPGSYPYNCSVHGKTMSGEIIVTAPK